MKINDNEIKELFDIDKEINKYCYDIERFTSGDIYSFNVYKEFYDSEGQYNFIEITITINSIENTLTFDRIEDNDNPIGIYFTDFDTEKTQIYWSGDVIKNVKYNTIKFLFIAIDDLINNIDK